MLDQSQLLIHSQYVSYYWHQPSASNLEFCCLKVPTSSCFYQHLQQDNTAAWRCICSQALGPQQAMWPDQNQKSGLLSYLQPFLYIMSCSDLWTNWKIIAVKPAVSAVRLKSSEKQRWWMCHGEVQII